MKNNSLRKQPQRALKKKSHQTTKNIFLYDLKFKSILPKDIYHKLSQTQQFAITLLHQYIGKPDDYSRSLQLMKTAIIDQQSIVKNLPISMQLSLDFQNLNTQNSEQIKHPDDKQLIIQTKQQYNQQIIPPAENDLDENIFLPLDSLIDEPKRQYIEDNNDFFHFEERNFATSIPPNEELDILSLID